MRSKICTLVILLLLLARWGFWPKETHAQSREIRQYSIDEFLSTTNYRGASFSPSGEKLLVSSDATGIYNAYSLPVDGGDVVQLTASEDDAIFTIGYFPEDERLLYQSDEGGNELYHIYVRDEDGVVTDLTPGERLRATFAGWAEDGMSFFIGTNERDPRFVDVYEYDVETYERTMIYENTDWLDAVSVSPDKEQLVLLKNNGNADRDLLLLDRSTGETRLLTDFEGDVENGGSVFGGDQAFSPDGKTLFYTTDKDHEFKYLVKHDLETDAIEEVLKPDWDVSFVEFSPNGKYLVVGINSDASTELRLYETSTMAPVDLPRMPEADIASVAISNDESLLAFYASSGRMPRDLFVAEIGDSPRRLTSSLTPEVDPEDLVDGRVVRFASYDGLAVPGILYMPHQATEEAKVPGLVWVHGGPGDQSRIGYNALLQYLINHGYAVYAINNRGSSGYGKTFFHLDDRRHGTADLDDVVESKKLLVETGFVDGARIGVIGRSYGGYMTLAALTFRPDAFEAGVDIFGISNWYRTVSSIPSWWESMRTMLEQEMGDFDDEEFFNAKSPLFHAEQIQKPLMVLQGANDPRVLQVESDDIVEAVRANNVPVEYIVFDDEGHGFAKKANQARGYKAVLDFLNQHLRDSGQ